MFRDEDQGGSCLTRGLTNVTAARRGKSRVCGRRVLEGWQPDWRAPRVGCAFEAGAEDEQRRLRPRPPDERDANRQSAHSAHRYGQMRIAGDCGQERRVARIIVALDEIDA